MASRAPAEAVPGRAASPAPRWDVALRKQLRQGHHAFTLDLAFETSASRLVLYGPSGAGKSQTLRLLAGISRPDAGHIRFGGEALFDHAAGIHQLPLQRRMGLVFQDYALFPHLNVRQNIAFALQTGWRNPGRRTEHPAVAQALEQLQLQAVAEQMPHQLSGGQRQRTALARALVAQPRALLLDEPFAALDRPLRQRLRQELIDLQQSLSMPMVLITHDEEDVAAFAEAVLILEAGRARLQVHAAPESLRT